jgi:hypothetical protein
MKATDVVKKTGIPDGPADRKRSPIAGNATGRDRDDVLKTEAQKE